MEGVTVRVLFFAKARELVGKSCYQITLPRDPARVSGGRLLELVVDSFPQLKGIAGSVALALDEEYISADQFVEIGAGSEIAVIPPLSGG